MSHCCWKYQTYFHSIWITVGQRQSATSAPAGKWVKNWRKARSKKKTETIKLKEHFISFDFDAKKVQRFAAKEKPLGPGLIYNRWMGWDGSLRMGWHRIGSDARWAAARVAAVLILRFSKALRAMDLEDHKL